MEQASTAGQPANPNQQETIEDKRKKLDADLQAGKISQAEYFKQVQSLGGGTSPQPGTVPAQAQAPQTAGAPQLPPAGSGSAQPVSPVKPVTPAPMPQEEVPPIGQALAVGSEDVEVVECYKCGGLITVTTKQRPVIIACPTCGTKGEVDASEPEPVAEPELEPKPTDAKPLEDDKLFKFSQEEKAKGPTFGSTLDEDLAKEGTKPPEPVTQPSPAPSAPQPAAAPAQQPSPANPTPTAPQQQKQSETKKEE